MLSDVHLEFKRSGKGLNFPVTAPYLCLLGDIGDPRTAVYQNFLHAQAERFDQVFVLKGNHSCYGRTPEQADALISAVCAAHPTKLKYLNKTAVDLNEDYVILGCTLWSHVLDEQRAMVTVMLADHRHIEGWSVSLNNEVHAAELAWLQAEVAKVEAAEKLAIVLTHDAPSFHRTAAPQHKSSPLSSAFCTDLESMFKLPVVLWMYASAMINICMECDCVPTRMAILVKVSNSTQASTLSLTFDAVEDIKVWELHLVMP